MGVDVANWLPELKALEVQLHQGAVRRSAARLQDLLHPEFIEVGRSGRVYDLDTAVRLLVAEQEHATLHADAFAICVLSSDAALLTYRSAELAADGSLSRHTLRSSLWVLSDGAWRLRYHQGTPAALTWSAT